MLLSAQERTRQLRQKILAQTTALVGVHSKDSSVWLAGKQGCAECACDPITLIISDAYAAPDPPSNPPYHIYYGYDISWNPIPGTTEYTTTFVSQDASVIIPTGDTSITLYIEYSGIPNELIIQTANCPCVASGSVQNLAPCFLAGSLIAMLDGTYKPIETVEVGDLILGVFGEINPVLALHRPLLGNARMIRINNEHSTTAHHPHVSTDKGFYCAEPATIETTTYGYEHEVIDACGNRVKQFLHGLRKGRVQQLCKGIELKTIEGGRIVHTVENLLDMPPSTQLYNLVTGGSHTYHVDGYAVTGWPREDDWDYDRWIPK